jgi:hypothetical protein
MNHPLDNSWFNISGALSPLDAPFTDIRFPDELARLVLEYFTRPGDWVLDPFAGFGTTLHVAQSLERNAVGFEPDANRAAHAMSGLHAPNRVIEDRVERLLDYDLAGFDFLFTSPPYVTVRLEDDPWGTSYFDDMRAIFRSIRQVLKPKASVVVEVSNIRTADGFRPLAFEFASLLGGLFEFRREIVRCNTGPALAGPGVNHSYLLVFINTLA